MAGVGFELKKLFGKKGLLASFKAYGYSALITAGPMLLGVLLLLGIMILCSHFGRSRFDRELLVCMITYTLLASLIVTSFFSMPLTRYIADMLYEERKENVIASFWGSAGIMLVCGCLVYGLFLLFSGATLMQGFLCFVFFGELIITWNATSYLTAIKDYRGIMLSLTVAIGTALALSGVLLYHGWPTVESVLGSVSIGYGVMAIWHLILLYRYFPQGEISAFFFLRWVDRFLPLALTGLFTNLGLMSHLVIMWFGPLQVKVKGLFVGAPFHDVPALLAFMTILVTTVNFVVSVEVNFYPKYRNYYSLFNDKGTIGDILQAEQEMLKVMRKELWYTALKQLFTTMTVIAFGSLILDHIPLGFNDLMHGYFRILCVGYGIYAIANMLMLMLLYFTDYKGSVLASGAFALSSTALTILSLQGPAEYFGIGFTLGSAVFFLAAVIRLDYYTTKLPYYILSAQPIVAEDKSGFFTRTGVWLEKNVEEDAGAAILHDRIGKLRRQLREKRTKGPGSFT